MSEKIKALSQRFPAEAHAQRKQGNRMLTYIGIEHTIGRLNDVFGEMYSTNIMKYEIVGDWVIVSVRISYVGDDGNTYSADGIGADLWTYVDTYGKTQVDMDKALKTAYAEGIKKAGHQRGIALYLWDDDVRKEVEAEMKGQTSNTANQTNGQSSNQSFSGNSTRLASPKQINKVAAEMTRVGWSDKDGRDYLAKTFNKLSRAELTSIEISKMIDHLISLPNKSA